MNCVEIEGKITNLILGELTQEEELIVHEHISSCEHCLQIHIELSQSISFVKAGVGAPEIAIKTLSEKDKIKIFESSIPKSIPFSFRNAKVSLTVAAGLFLAFVILNRLGYDFEPKKEMEIVKLNDDTAPSIEVKNKKLKSKNDSNNRGSVSDFEDSDVVLERDELEEEEMEEKRIVVRKTKKTMQKQLKEIKEQKKIQEIVSNDDILPKALKKRDKIFSLKRKKGFLRTHDMKDSLNKLLKILSINNIPYQLTDKKTNGVHIIKIGQELQYEIGLATNSPILKNQPKLENFTSFENQPKLENFISFKIHQNIILYKSQKEKSKAYSLIFFKIKQSFEAIK